MPRKLMTPKDWSDVAREIMKHGVGELQTKGLTEEEENREMKKTFEEISAMGYAHIHTLKVVPADKGREPYFVHRDDII